MKFKGVPLPLITPKGVSWLASQIETPVNKFIREGLDITVCVVRNIDEEVKSSLEVVLTGGEHSTIVIEYRKPRVYQRKGKEVWKVVAVAIPATSLGF
ncbi:hypothetical protein LINPERPRIM_LOCUS24756 [Linum perenne]